jgi:hypothetical protein
VAGRGLLVELLVGRRVAGVLAADPLVGRPAGGSDDPLLRTKATTPITAINVPPAAR